MGFPVPLNILVGLWGTCWWKIKRGFRANDTYTQAFNDGRIYEAKQQRTMYPLQVKLMGGERLDSIAISGTPSRASWPAIGFMRRLFRSVTKT